MIHWQELTLQGKAVFDITTGFWTLGWCTLTIGATTIHTKFIPTTISCINKRLPEKKTRVQWQKAFQVNDCFKNNMNRCSENNTNPCNIWSPVQPLHRYHHLQVPQLIPSKWCYWHWQKHHYKRKGATTATFGPQNIQLVVDMDIFLHHFFRICWSHLGYLTIMGFPEFPWHFEATVRWRSLALGSGHVKLNSLGRVEKSSWNQWV